MKSGLLYFQILSIVLLFFVSGTALAETRPAPETSAETPSVMPASGLDFESYQRSIDDMFQIALMTNPNVDSGVNSVIVDLNRRIAQEPDNPQPFISLGHIYRILGQPAEANRFYEQALSKNPRDFHTHIFSALTNFQEEEFSKAAERLEKAIELNPTDLYPRLALGRMQMMLKRDQAAAETFERVLEIQPENRPAAFALSLLYQRMGRREDALEILEGLKESNPDDLFVRYHLGALALVEGSAAKALEYWTEIYQQGVRDPQFLLNLSIAYLENDEGAKAEKILDHLHFFFPEEQGVEVLLAEAYRTLGRMEEAERRYRLVLADSPRYVVAYLGLAEVLREQGKLEESEEVLQAAAGYVQQEEALLAEQKRLAEVQKEIFQPAE